MSIVKKICPQCLKAFTVIYKNRSNKCCSVKCADLAKIGVPNFKRRRRFKTNCYVCGSPIDVPLSQAKDKKFCNAKCYGIGRSMMFASGEIVSWNKGKRFGKRYLESLKPKFITCKLCGLKKEAPNRNRKYCSDCRGLAFNTRDRLNALKFRIRHKEKYRNRPQNKERADERRDERRYNGNRKLVLERDNNQCQWPKCGRPNGLVMHHKDGSGNSSDKSYPKRKPNNKMENLITLCRKHHMRTHSIIDMAPKVFLPIE